MITYFVEAVGAGFVKIGRTENPWPRHRLHTIQSNCPHEVRFLGCVRGLVEREMHARFAAYHHRGEWYRLEGELAEFVLGLEQVEAA